MLSLDEKLLYDRLTGRDGTIRNGQVGSLDEYIVKVQREPADGNLQSYTFRDTIQTEFPGQDIVDARQFPSEDVDPSKFVVTSYEFLLENGYDPQDFREHLLAVKPMEVGGEIEPFDWENLEGAYVFQHNPVAGQDSSLAQRVVDITKEQFEEQDDIPLLAEGMDIPTTIADTSEDSHVYTVKDGYIQPKPGYIIAVSRPTLNSVAGWRSRDPDEDGIRESITVLLNPEHLNEASDFTVESDVTQEMYHATTLAVFASPVYSVFETFASSSPSLEAPSVIDEVTARITNEKGYTGLHVNNVTGMERDWRTPEKAYR